MKTFISFIHSLAASCLIFTSCKQLFLTLRKINLSLSLILVIIGTVYSANVFADHYVAGSTTIFIHDPSRTFQPYGINPTNPPGSIRTNDAEMWYPVDPESIYVNSIRARYIDYLQGMDDVCEGYAFRQSPQIGSTALPGVTASQIAAADQLWCSTTDPAGLRGSYLDAPIAKGVFPVVILSLGSQGHREIFGSYAETLAQNGYIVVSAENTGDTIFGQPAKDPHFCDQAFNRVLCVANGSGGYIPNPAIFKVSFKISNPAAPPNALTVVNTDGGILPPAIAGAGALPTLGITAMMKLADALATANAIKSMNAGNPCSALSTTCDPTLPNNFTGHFDLANMAIMGHSAGNEVVLQTLNTNSDYKIGIAMMPVSITNIFGSRPVIQKPIMYMTAQMDDQIIPGTCSNANLGYATAPIPTNRDPDVLNQYNAATNVAVYMTLLDDTHNHFHDDYLSYFPSLSSTTAYDPLGPVSPYCTNTFTIPFTLVPSATVHEILADRTIPFLDLYLKQHNRNAHGIFQQLINLLNLLMLTAPDHTGYMTLMYRNLDVNDFLNHGPPNNK